jgi:hypothetical protein
LLLRFATMDQPKAARRRIVFKSITDRVRAYFDVLKSSFSSLAETDLERAERQAREKRKEPPRD